MTKKTRGWRVLKPDCEGRYYYLRWVPEDEVDEDGFTLRAYCRLIRGTHHTSTIHLRPFWEFETRDEALEFLKSSFRYDAWEYHWRSHWRSEIVLESPTGEQTKYDLFPIRVATDQSGMKSHLSQTSA